MKVDIQPYPVSVVKSDVPEHDWEKYYKLKPGDVFVEVGAFWGRYAILADKARCSKIILIEPSPINIATIKNFVQNEELRNVVVIEKAIGNKRGTIEFDISGNSAGHCVIEGNPFVDTVRKGVLIRNNDEFKTIDIQVDTLDNVLKELKIDKVDLLACDCEGEEVHLLEGLSKYLNERRIKHLALGAYHTLDIHKDVMKILTEYRYYGIRYEEGVVYASSDNVMLSKEEILNKELKFD